MPLSLIHSHLISESEAYLSQFTLSTPVIKLWSLNSLSQHPPNLDVIDPPAVPSHRSASDPHRHPPQTHAIDCLKPTSLSFFFLSLSLSPFLAPIGSHITRLTSNQSIPFRFELSIIVYDHWSMIGVGLVSRYRIGQSIRHGFRFCYVDFFGFLFCSSSLVLMGTMGLWLCSDFYGFDGGCGGVLVVEWNIILL